MGERYVACPVRGLVPAEDYHAEQYEKRTRAKSGLSCPNLSLDTMAPVRSMLDGKFYDSKAALRATYKAHGVTEVGNDSSVKEPRRKAPKRTSRAEIRASVRKAASRMGLDA